MTYVTPRDPVSDAVFAVLRDDTLEALATGGIFGDLPEDPTYPCLWFEVTEPQQYGGFGTKPGTKTLPQIDIRLHAFSRFGGFSECAAILTRAIALLSATNALSVSGYTVCGADPFHDATVSLPDTEINGVKIKELVSMHRLYVEAQ